MTKQELSARIDKIFRANTIEVKEIIGQYDECKMVKRIGDIEELKSDLKELINAEFKVGKINKSEIFNGTGKLGASYNIKEAIKAAKEWGYKYIKWNDGQIYDLSGSPLDLYFDEI